VLHLEQWPESVEILGVEFPVYWADLGTDAGDMDYEPSPGGTIQIRVHQRFKGTDFAWLVLFHEMTHAALQVAGTTELIRGAKSGEETLVLSIEAVWRALVAVGGRRVSKRASRGAKGRTTGRKRVSTPRSRQSSR
jgi:hypothetical protein